VTILATAHAVVDRPAVREPSEKTVSRHLVHRLAVSEVLLTDWRADGPDTFTAQAQLPRAHSFYDTADGRHDPLLLAEAVRQVGLLISHAEFGVPLGYQFILRGLGLEADLGELAVRDRPADLSFQISCHDIRRRGRILAGMHVHVHVYRDGSPVGTAHLLMDCVSRGVYQRLRQLPEIQPPAAPLGAPVAPATVGRDRERDVVLSPTADPLVWGLRVDQSHPVLFDHEVDHVPGMLLMESMRQAAQCVLAPNHTPVRSLQTDFHRYAELFRPCVVRAVPQPPTAGGQHAVKVTVEQDGDLIADGTLAG